MKSQKIMPYVFVSPFFILYAIFGLYPTVYALYLSFFEKVGFSEGKFIGIGNYTSLFSDTRFIKALWNTSYYAIGSVFIILPIALSFAILLNSKYIEKFKGFFTSSFYLPLITSAIVVAIMFTLVFDYEYGLLNAFLRSLKLPTYRWLQDPIFGIPTLIILGIWRYAGINALYFLSGLQSISEELHDAARIDGANKWQAFWYVTFPLLKPVTLFVVVQAIIGSYNLFAEPFILAGQGTGGAGAGDGMLMMTAYLYINGFRFLRMGYASAIGFVLMIIIFVLTLIQLRIFRMGEID